MFNLKRDEAYSFMSEDRKIIQGKGWFVNIREYYGDNHMLQISLYEKHQDTCYVCRHSSILPLNMYSLYITHIYKHLGKCHPDLRSKFYIGKPVELTWKRGRNGNRI